jgi:hypothetical protein
MGGMYDLNQPQTPLPLSVLAVILTLPCRSGRTPKPWEGAEKVVVLKGRDFSRAVTAAPALRLQPLRDLSVAQQTFSAFLLDSPRHPSAGPHICLIVNIFLPRLHRNKERCHQQYDEPNPNHPHIHANHPFYNYLRLYRSLPDHPRKESETPSVLWCTIPKNGIPRILLPHATRK